MEKIKYRGKDGSGFYSGKGVCLAHCLHSVVNDIKQPLENQRFVLGANCEIYNWKFLRDKYGFSSGNDAELLLDLFSQRLENFAERSINRILAELDGVFAFFLYEKKTGALVLARDRIGEKPLWFSYKGNKLCFASERKALIDAEELNPRKIVLFKDGMLKLFNQPFFVTSEDEADLRKVEAHIKALLESAVNKRVAERKLGLLFSGGLDSTVLAFLLKKINVPFTCYMAVCGDNDDSNAAERIAEALGLDLRIVKVPDAQIEKELRLIINLIESADPVKIEVAATLFFALKAAGKDCVKVVFSGVGADDIFCGYKRMLAAKDVNLDSLSNLRRIYERDLYRDDVISMYNNIELRLPFLDHSLVKEVLRVPSRYKIGEETKPLLRSVAGMLGLKHTSMRRKAAQYGSGIHNAVDRLARKNGFKSKSAYLSSLSSVPQLRLGALFSGGKDSVYALHIQKRLNYDIACLITVQSRNPDSYMFHTPNISFAKYQAEALGLPIVMKRTEGIEEEELKDLRKALKCAKDKYKIQGIVTGALFSNYQRSRIEKVCDELNLKVFSPLWHMDQEVEMRALVREGFKVIMVKVAAEGLDKSWLGRVLTQDDIYKLATLNKKFGFNVAGEGGEFETFVLYAPLFKKRLEIKKAHLDGDVLVIDDVSLTGS